MFNLIPWKKKEGRGELQMWRRDDPFTAMRQQFDTLFERMLSNFFEPGTPYWGLGQGWDIDHEDTGKEFVVRAEAPGFEASDFNIQLSGNWLTIQAEHRQENGDRHTERRFQRSFTLPPGVDVDRIEARYHNGILELHLPKSAEALGKRIEVKSE